MPFSWRSLAFSVLGIVAACGLALLLIEPLSLRAAVQGSVIALGAIVFSRLAVWWWYKRRRDH